MAFSNIWRVTDLVTGPSGGPTLNNRLYGVEIWSWLWSSKSIWTSSLWDKFRLWKLNSRSAAGLFVVVTRGFYSGFMAEARGNGWKGKLIWIGKDRKGESTKKKRFKKASRLHPSTPLTEKASGESYSTAAKKLQNDEERSEEGYPNGQGNCISEESSAHDEEQIRAELGRKEKIERNRKGKKSYRRMLQCTGRLEWVRGIACIHT